MAKPKAAIDKGMFNFQDVMNEFCNYKPKADDSEGRAIKNNFKANMVQEGCDAQLAKEKAKEQASNAQEKMITADELEQRNT